MTTAEDIERIVLEVIRRLTAKPSAMADQGTLLIDESVITLATLGSRLKGVRQVVVQPRAVVTPSVQDELRANHIQLVRQSQPASNQNRLRLILANPGSTIAADLIEDLSCEVTTLGPAPLSTSISNMTSMLTQNALGAILTEQPEAAACLANRHHHVNAFVGYGSDSIHRAITTMEANLLVVESSSNTSTMKDMLHCFVSGHGGRAK